MVAMIFARYAFGTEEIRLKALIFCPTESKWFGRAATENGNLDGEIEAQGAKAINISLVYLISGKAGKYGKWGTQLYYAWFLNLRLVGRQWLVE